MRKGGYQIIDFKDVVLTSGTPETIKGVYSQVTNNNRKPFLLSGLTVKATSNGEAEVLNDEWANFAEGESGYTASLVGGATILVTSADAVTYTAPAN